MNDLNTPVMEARVLSEANGDEPANAGRLDPPLVQDDAYWGFPANVIEDF